MKKESTPPESGLASGWVCPSMSDKALTLATAMVRFEQQFNVQINVVDALQHRGPYHFTYTENGDDVFVTVLDAESGDVYAFRPDKQDFMLVQTYNGV